MEFQRPINFFKAFSLLAFLVVLLYVYAVLPNEILILWANGMAHRLAKTNFFYLSIIVFFGTNVLIYGAVFLLKNNYSERMIGITAWLNGFSAVLNVFFSCAVLAIWAINENFTGFVIKSLFFSGIFLVTAWFFPLLYFIRKP